MIHVFRWNATGVESLGSDYSAGIPSEPDVWVWVDVVDETAVRIEDVGRVFGLDATAIEDIVAASNMPLLEEHMHAISVGLHGFTVGDDGEVHSPEIDAFVGERFLVTIREGPTMASDATRDRLIREGDLPVSSPAELLAFLAFAAGKRYQPLIQELEKQVDDLEELAIQGDPRAVVEIQALRKDVIYLRRVVAPQFDVFEDLSNSRHPVIDDRARIMFSRVANQHRRALESIDTGRALLTSVVETYRGAVADQTNEIMRVLTVFSAILLPLTLIAGLWGMNFDEIPGSSIRNGFWILVGLMILLAGSVWFYFSRRGFVGAPRLRELPRAVGLGLYKVGSAPIRAMTGGTRERERTEGDKG